MNLVQGKPISIKRASKVWVEWEESVLLGKRLESRLASQGMQVARSKDEADAQLKVVASAAMWGGPKLGRKSVRVNVSKVFDETQGSAAIATEGGKESSRLTAGGFAIDTVAASGWMNQSVSPLMQGIGIQSFLVGLVEASGFTGWLNQKLGLDPRGFCFKNCENWHKMDQGVVLMIYYKDVDGRNTLRIRSDTMAEKPVIDRLFNDALLQMDPLILMQGEDKP